MGPVEQWWRREVTWTYTPPAERSALQEAWKREGSRADNADALERERVAQDRVNVEAGIRAENLQNDRDRAKGLLERHRTPGERYREESGEVEGLFGRGLFEPWQADRIQSELLHEYRKSLGFRHPLADFERSMRDIEEVPGVSPAERRRRERELRGETVSEMLRDYHDVTAAPAMEAGSAEAYSAIVQAQLQSPTIALAQQANSELQQIVAGIREQNAMIRGRQVGKMLGSTGTPW